MARSPVRTPGWLTGLVAAGAMTVGHARTQPSQTAPPPPPPPAPAARQVPPELQASRDAAKLTDPAARIKAYDAILAAYPHSLYLVDFHLQKLSALQAIPPVDLHAVDEVVAATRSATTPRTPHEVLSLIAMTLGASDATVSRAEALAREAIASIDEETYARDWQKRYARHPDDPKEWAAQYKEGKSRFAGDLSRDELILGRILVREGRDADAQAAFEKALAIVPLQGSAALALATIAETSGDTAGAYKGLAWAAITGRLPAADRPRLDAAYAALHPGAPPAALDADLDRLFRESFKNPIVAGRYVPSRARTTRTVLAEMVTGAGCVPCVSVDLSLETMLERYSRDELVVLMYHIHAPTSDPLSNPSAQARAGYYGATEAPELFLDGVRDVAEGPREDAPEVFQQIDAQVGRRLEAPPAATLHLGATIRGSIVTVQATAGSFAAGGADAPDLRLQVALVERLVRYSGENGQRFHPMVVRAMGGAGAAGFPLDATKPTTTASTVFDLDALGAENLQYYDDYARDLKARTGLVTGFREKKHVIDPRDLAVVAFVQDGKTHRVLQAAFATPK